VAQLFSPSFGFFARLVVTTSVMTASIAATATASSRPAPLRAVRRSAPAWPAPVRMRWQ